MIYIFGFAIGYGPIPWAMNAELFPKEAQGIMAPIAGGFNWLCAFIVTKFGTNLEDVINTSGLYFLFGAVNAFGLIFVIFFLPETKGKTPDDMKRYFRKISLYLINDMNPMTSNRLYLLLREDNTDLLLVLVMFLSGVCIVM